jgi:ATP phosphoribosyltransferase
LDKSKRLRIALQKSGKLSEGSIDLLNKCSFNLRPAKNHYLVKSNELSSDFLMVRDDDIPGFIDSGACDIGIIGENLFVEYQLSGQNKNVEIIARLKFANCRLSIAVINDGKITKMADLEGKTIATSYPATLKDYLKKHKVNANIIIMHGSVELAPKIGIADAICDLVSTGTTLKENGLFEMQVILESEAVLVGHTNLDNEIQNRVNELVFRFQSVIKAKNAKYIMLHIDKANVPLLKELLPGCEAPTTLALDGHPEKVAVHVVSEEHVFWDTITKLKSIGATSILSVAIEKLME